MCFLKWQLVQQPGGEAVKPRPTMPLNSTAKNSRLDYKIPVAHSGKRLTGKSVEHEGRYLEIHPSLAATSVRMHTAISMFGSKTNELIPKVNSGFSVLIFYLFGFSHL